jgi:hypothetical protein
MSAQNPYFSLLITERLHHSTSLCSVLLSEDFTNLISFLGLTLELCSIHSFLKTLGSLFSLRDGRELPLLFFSAYVMNIRHLLLL